MRFCLPLVLISVLSTFGDTHTLDTEKSAVALKVEAAAGIPLPTITPVTTVRDSIGLTAVLLTQGSVRRLFGKEIANTYAVVQLTISNKNSDAAFVLHSAYIDTSQWALGGGSKGFTASGSGKGPVDRAETQRRGGPPNRIASVESRIARGQLLDAQLWSARNWTVRILTTLGSMAAGYSFAFNEIGIAKGIAAFNGNVVPGVAYAWPDGAVAQQNRISDFGYQTNKIIAKESADIVVCFFPIDMFLSEPFRQIFLKSPALFLSPYQLLFTGAVNERLLPVGFAEHMDALRKLHPCYSKIYETTAPADESKGKSKQGEAIEALRDATEQQIVDTCSAVLKKPENQGDIVLLDYIKRFGLQNIGVYVDGVMTIDVDAVPASIDGVTFDGDPAKPESWAAAGTHTGTIKCRFCTGAEVSITEAAQLGITEVKKVAAGSDDQHVKFSLTLTKPIESQQTLTFVLIKQPEDSKKSGHEVKSAPFVYTVAYVQIGPSITGVTVKDQKVSVAGTGFFNTKANPMVVTLEAKGSSPVTATTSDTTGTSFTFDIPAKLGPGCWSVHLSVGTMAAAAPEKAGKVLVEPTPKLKTATLKTDAIFVTGEQLVDTAGCTDAKPLAFQLLKDGEKNPVAAAATFASATEVSLKVPEAAKTGKWQVQVLQGTEVKSSADLK